jgi:hypothetical protein
MASNYVTLACPERIQVFIRKFCQETAASAPTFVLSDSSALVSSWFVLPLPTSWYPVFGDVREVLFLHCSPFWFSISCAGVESRRESHQCDSGAK